MHSIDSNGNVISVSETTERLTANGFPMVVVRLLEQPSRGYISEVEPDGGFGTDECPSSYGRPCLTWFGPGERFEDAYAAILACTDV